MVACYPFYALYQTRTTRVIPLLMLLMPLMRVAPPLVRWQTRRKIYRWYAQLRQIDQQAIHGMSEIEAQQSLEDLLVLEKLIAHVGIPLSYMEEYYNLRLHLDLVRSKVHAIAGACQTTIEKLTDEKASISMAMPRKQFRA